MEIVKGSGRNAVVHKKVMPFPVGITTLPVKGGMLDQPYRLMEFFYIFLNAERRAVYKELSK